MAKNPNAATREAAIKQRLKIEAENERVAKEATEKLYSLRCFETMNHASGAPIAMRVPGGWLFYTASGGGRLNLSVSEGEETEQILGEQRPLVHAVFVPYNEEFLKRVIQ